MGATAASSSHRLSRQGKKPRPAAAAAAVAVRVRRVTWGRAANGAALRVGIAVGARGEGLRERWRRLGGSGARGAEGQRPLCWRRRRARAEVRGAAGTGSSPDGERGGSEGPGPLWKGLGKAEGS